IVPSPDSKRVAFVRSASDAPSAPAPGAGRGGRGGAGGGASDVVIRSLADGRETVVAHDDRSIGALGWSPDGQHLVYTAGASTIRHDQTPAYSGVKIIYTINENVPGQTFAVAAMEHATPKELSSGAGFGQRRWLDARHFLV